MSDPNAERRLAAAQDLPQKATAKAAPKADPQPAMPPQLIVGLGNPGAKYTNTRHNIGFDAVDALGKRWLVSLGEHKKFKGEFGEAMVPRLGSNKLRLLKPQTYMNLSGQSIRAVVDWYKIPPEAVLLVYDDMDLPLGRLRLRLSGSAGGHNGVKSAIAHLGTQNIPRLRIGIGAPRLPGGDRDATVSHVLGKFSPNEQKLVDEVLLLTTEAIELGLRQSLEKAMSLYNNREAVPG
ncbi:MAG: aminoacyl-tRNA hydrolase [Synechococcales cyanobacterium RM1_1_8]|nr:aminoacyl-tRNA hydrolase [Synechococcales cyanobacterium RM1_1_8]